MAKVTLLFGRICSGKGSYRKDSYRIVASNLVKALIANGSRTALQETKHLDQQIADSILMAIDKAIQQEDAVLVDGIRQISIVERVLEQYPDAELIWLEVPTEERRRRYENRKDVKDTQPFDVADNKELELECQKIFELHRDRLQIINNY